MATIEKPKHKKSKKTKVRHNDDLVTIQNDKEIEETPTSSSALAQSTEDLEKKALGDSNVFDELKQFEDLAAQTNEIISHECGVSAEYTRTNSDNQLAYDVENISLHDELAAVEATVPAAAEAVTSTAQEINEATAPSADRDTQRKVLKVTITPVQYPNLMPLQHVERSAEIIYHNSRIKTPSFSSAKSDLKPFTKEQLQQIYHCAELEYVKQFELEFLTNSLLVTYENDPLYLALADYYDLQSKLKMNLHDIQEYREKCLETQERIWVEERVIKKFSGVCGDGTTLYKEVKYDKMKVEKKNLLEATDALTKLFNLLCNNYITNRFTAGITKAKIDQMIDSRIACPIVATMATKSQVTLQTTLDPEALQVIAQLRHAISILFFFKRKRSPNKTFDNNINTWIRKLVSSNLLMATKEDHWFLLFNILRCPSGISNWATDFLQIPFSTATTGDDRPMSSKSGAVTAPMQLISPEISHCVAVLQILLFPIKKRNDYLKEFIQDIIDPVQEDRWILVDSDGEDSHTSAGDCIGLKESDLIALLNQIPFEQLFCAALGIEKFLGDYIIDANYISASQMLHVIAFFSRLVDIFGEGMITYNTERYKQLAKRLGRLVRHILQYISDYHELFIQNKHCKNPSECERIAVELNALLLKACSYIHCTRNLATWQYFSSLPYHTLDTETIWQIFYYLNVGFPPELPSENEDYPALLHAGDFWLKFNVANSDSSPEDLYYLLQAFFEMANERDKLKDWDLIKELCLHIFNIGFINEPTRDFCYKTARDMLVNLTLAYEDLMSCLLLQMKVRFYDVENVMYLFKTLPLENWKPGMDSFELLSNWLLNFDYKSQENMLARLVISHLNWSFDSDGRLFLPHNIHVRMACLIAEALSKHAPEVIGKSSVADIMRHVSSLVDFTQTTKEHFTNWCWSMISILRLHLMDQGVESIRRTLQNPTEPLMFIPELNRIDMIYEGVTENRSISIFVGILVSLHGHSIPLICQKGFELMKLLLNDYRHAAVIRCIELIIPLFLETPETLASCENFQFILNNLLNADKTYLKMAKDMVYANSMGPVMELFDSMIHHQIISYTSYGLASPLNLVSIWLNCFTGFPNWQSTNIVYLLDKLLRIVYQFPDCRAQATEYLHHYFKDCEEWKGNNKLSALKTFFSSNQSRIPAFLPQHSWLTMVLLEIEFKTQDKHFWSEFLRQIAASDGNTNLEAVLKKTTNVVKKPTFSANMLVLYKYANLIAGMDIRHPLFPIANQKFFELYLSRLPLHYDEQNYQHVFAVSNKFYEFNVPLMKKIKANLKAAETHYNNEALKCATDDGLSYFYRNCSKLMKTYMLWLEDTAINKLSPDEQNYPAQYNNEKLRDIFNGNTQHWTEFIYLPAVREEQKQQADQWAAKCYRLKTHQSLRTPVQAKAKSTPIERIKTHLSSYDKNLEPPVYTKPTLFMPKEINKSTLYELKELLKKQNSTVTQIHFKSCELNALNRNYLDTVVELYKMESYNEVIRQTCDSMLFNKKCSSPACIYVTMERIKTNDAVVSSIKDYHERHNKLIQNLVDFHVDDFARNVELLNGSMRALLEHQATQNQPNEVVTKTGISFFYTIIEHLTDITMKFIPTNDLYSQLMNDLGVFIQENQEQQGNDILQLALERPELIKSLAGVLVPYRTGPECFLKMYKFLIDSYLKRSDTKVLFVLFSKFDLMLWLDTFHPKLHDINQLLHLILQGLVSWSQPDSTLLQDQFRRHLVHTFNYDFPQHYGEVLQSVLDCVSDEKLMPVVLLDLLNSMLKQFSCDSIDLQSTQEQIQQISIDFAKKQKLFNLKASTDTLMLFARHFQKERLHHGLHGLYPKHKDYCQPLSAWFSCLGYVVVTNAICTYQELLADQISDIVFGSIAEMYSPWLITYNEQTMQMQTTATWIRQLTEHGKMLYPWSEQHAATSKIMIQTFINTLKFILDYLPASYKVLDHTFGWYIHHFAIDNLETYVYAPVHEGIATLPWELFKPQSNYIELIYESVQKYIPECHAMLGHIFIRINWNNWFAERFPTFPMNAQSHVVSRLFVVFIKIAFEPNIHINITTSKILEDAINYPWHMMDYGELEMLLNWVVTTVEPSIVLKLPVESNYADRAVLDLIRLTCAMMPERTPKQQINYATAKRILYTRSMVRLLRACATKNQRLLVTKVGQNAFKNAFLDLLNVMSSTINSLEISTIQESTTTTTLLEQQKREALNLMIEILTPMQTQSEETSNLLIDSLIKYQEKCAAGDFLLLATPSAIGHLKHFIAGTYSLLESALENYFRTTQVTNEWHNPTWSALLDSVKMSMNKFELMPIMSGPFFFTLHVFIIYKIEQISNVGDKITFLQDLTQLMESLKTNPQTEARFAMLWGIVISRGCLILSQSEHAKKPLIMLARSLQMVSTQAEGWGDTFLGAVGFKKDAITNKRKVLTRCLAIAVLSILPDTSTSTPQPSQEYNSALRELSYLVANKKYTDVKSLIAKAVAILNEDQLPEPRDMPHLISRLIHLFYECNYLTTIPEVWDFDYSLS